MGDRSPCDWIGYFSAAFREVKTKFSKIYPIRDDETVPSNILAARNAVDNLPYPAEILQLRVDTPKYKQLENQTCQLAGNDLSQIGEQSTRYCGIIDTDDTRGFNDFLAKKHGLVLSKTIANGFHQNFKTTHSSDTDNPDIHFHFLFYNIQSKFERYVKDLLGLILVRPLSYQVVEKFKEE